MGVVTSHIHTYAYLELIYCERIITFFTKISILLLDLFGLLGALPSGGFLG